MSSGGGAARGADPYLLEDVRRLPILGGDLHDDVVLVERIVDGRDRPLAECIIERVVNLAYGHPKPRCGRPVNRDLTFKTRLLLVGVHVGQRRVILESLQQLRCPLEHLGRAVAS